MVNKVQSEKLTKVKKKVTNKYLGHKVSLETLRSQMIFIKFWMAILYLKKLKFGKEYI
jgi:hypothetical protein